MKLFLPLLLLPSPAPSEEPSEEPSTEPSSEPSTDPSVETISDSDYMLTKDIYFKSSDMTLYKDSAGTQPILTNKGNQVYLGTTYLGKKDQGAVGETTVYNVRTSDNQTILIAGNSQFNGERAVYTYIERVTEYGTNYIYTQASLNEDTWGVGIRERIKPV